MLIEPKTNKVEFQSEGQKHNYDAHLLFLSLVVGVLTKRECCLRTATALGQIGILRAGNGRCS